MGTRIELSIVMPCLNEAATIGRCIAKARAFLNGNAVSGEIVVADNGSSDGSQSIARTHGVRLVDVAERGYGSALLGGIRAARGKYVIMGDSDDSYDFSRLLCRKAARRLSSRDGQPLSRWHHAWRNVAAASVYWQSLLTTIGRLFFRSDCRDFY